MVGSVALILLLAYILSDRKQSMLGEPLGRNESKHGPRTESICKRLKKASIGINA